MNSDRSIEIDHVMEAGRKACLQGIPVDMVPAKYANNLNRRHWIAGHREQSEQALPMLGDEVSHVHQFLTLQNQAKNFGLELGIVADGFNVLLDGSTIGIHPTLFELRAAISDYVAAERAAGRKI